MTNGERVTLRDVYAVVNERFDKLEVSMDKRLCAAETEIGELKLFKANLLGRLAVIGSGLAFVASFVSMAIWDFIKNKLGV